MHCQLSEYTEPSPVRDKTIVFEDGLYGLEHIKEYELISTGKQDNPFRWLRALSGEVCFIVMDPRHIEPDYDFELPDDAIAKLGATNDTQFVVLSIVVLPDRVENMTINLKSPLVINSENRRGMQLILDEDKYELRRRLVRG